ncbi:DNA primase large subunit PriL [Pyrobaculum calidifontis]|uniref:DNA primase large subunit PriL n=1 Tax=Pyrobaculum calidifontis (strain DSM 21063 / JCM 11548 / VA1) TaxID=410359 RepID=A3MUR0_PYRCJ|nr:DNA primase large subunit PriL [Pyrobaculum calidifontis]ABO08377.1 DNA primase large subunit [Pyrobaculum calidifontis JCM 11548]
MSCDISADVFACYFPFLNRSASYLAKRGYVLESVLDDRDMVEKAIERVRRAVARESFNAKSCLDRPEEGAVVARLALYLAAATGSSHILRRFADYESKNFASLLDKIPGVQSPGCKIEIGKDLGIYAKPSQEVMSGIAVVQFPIAVRWSTYLKYAPQDPHWAMINRVVVRGWVLLPMADYHRLLEEAYEERILKTVDENELAVGKVAMKVDMSKLEDLVKKYSYKPLPQAPVAGGPDPPCMKAILDALKAGENLPHTARFAITTYLLKRGWDVEQIVDLFRNAPDFNEKITRYQVQHIAGKVGGRKEYAVPSCETMNSWGLCPTNLGCNVRNPLQYGKRVAVKKSS